MPTRRQWTGCLVMAVLFVAALVIAVAVVENLLGIGKRPGQN
jgi:hypothetical protein